MTEAERNLYLDGDDGLKPYLRMKGKGMPANKIRQIAWLLLNGGGCGFCKICRDESCGIKDGESCTDNIANYIKRIVLEDVESEHDKPKTNADRIRAMSDEELAEFLYDTATSAECNICQMKQGWTCSKTENETCNDGVIKWLQSEVEE